MHRRWSVFLIEQVSRGYLAMYSILLLSFLLRATIVQAAAGSVDFERDRAQRFLRWFDHPNTNSVHPYRLGVSVNGRNLGPVPVDTGSTGFVVSAWLLGYEHASELAGFDPAFEFLSSSGVYYNGYWVPSTVIFTPETGNKMASEFPVFAVTETGLCDTALTCADTRHNYTDMPKTGPRYMGVGFGRVSAEQPNATSDKNALLNVDLSRLANIHRGYAIGKEGVLLGVRDTDIADGYRLIQLIRNSSSPVPSGLPEWNSTPICVEVADSPCFQGTALFDTGIDYSFLAVPRHTTRGHEVKCGLNNTSRCLSGGTEVTVRIGHEGNYVATYTYQADQFDQVPQVTPNRTVVEGGEKDYQSFINTGRFFYNGFDLIFDAEVGLLGLRSSESRGPNASRQRTRLNVQIPAYNEGL